MSEAERMRIPNLDGAHAAEANLPAIGRVQQIRLDREPTVAVQVGLHVVAPLRMPGVRDIDDDRRREVAEYERTKRIAAGHCHVRQEAHTLDVGRAHLRWPRRLGNVDNTQPAIKRDHISVAAGDSHPANFTGWVVRRHAPRLSWVRHVEHVQALRR
jgi:hypothetical protein